MNLNYWTVIFYTRHMFLQQAVAIVPICKWICMCLCMCGERGIRVILILWMRYLSLTLFNTMKCLLTWLLTGRRACKLTHLSLDKLAANLANNFKCIFINEKFCISILISLKFLPRVQLTIGRYWFRQWFGADQVTHHYLSQRWPNSLTHICGNKGDE